MFLIACRDEGKPVITLRRDSVDFALSYYGEPAGVTAALLPMEATAYAAEPTAHARLSEKLHSGMTYRELRPGMDVEMRFSMAMAARSNIRMTILIALPALAMTMMNLRDSLMSTIPKAVPRL